MTTFVKSDDTFVVFPRVSSISCHEGEMDDLVILSVNTYFSVIFSPLKLKYFHRVCLTGDVLTGECDSVNWEKMIKSYLVGLNLNLKD